MWEIIYIQVWVIFFYKPHYSSTSLMRMMIQGDCDPFTVHFPTNVNYKYTEINYWDLNLSWSDIWLLIHNIIINRKLILHIIFRFTMTSQFQNRYELMNTLSSQHKLIIYLKTIVYFLNSYGLHVCVMDFSRHSREFNQGLRHTIPLCLTASHGSGIFPRLSRRQQLSVATDNPNLGGGWGVRARCEVWG